MLYLQHPGVHLGMFAQGAWGIEAASLADLRPVTSQSAVIPS